MRLWHGVAYKPNNKSCVDEPQSERDTYGRGPYDVEIVEVSQSMRGSGRVNQVSLVWSFE